MERYGPRGYCVLGGEGKGSMLSARTGTCRNIVSTCSHNEAVWLMR